jgi:hypothetical protein
MGKISRVEDIANAALDLDEAERVAGEVVHVDGGAHLGRW